MKLEFAQQSTKERFSQREDSRDLQRISLKNVTGVLTDLPTNDRKHLSLGKEPPDRIRKNNTKSSPRTGISACSHRADRKTPYCVGH